MDLEVVFQLVLALVLGAAIGLERERKKKKAGFQTYSLVSLGGCLFAIVALNSFILLAGSAGVRFDPSRIVMAVATGIGFIGAGVIIFHQDRVEGTTTAAGLWCAAAIGIAVGIKFYLAACVASVLVLIVFAFFGFLERKIFEK